MSSLGPMRIDEILKWVKGPEVLDVGCTAHNVELDSPHWLHGRLRQQYANVTGVDISTDNILTLRNAGLDNLYVQSAEDLSFDKKFDTIVAGELIEHLSNPGLFLQRAREHLAHEGRLILTTPNAFSLFAFQFALLRYPRTCSNPEHTCWFCPQTLGVLIERYGFKVIHFDLVDTSGERLEKASFRYRISRRLIALLGPLVPKRLRANTMLFVLVPIEK